MTFFGRYGGQFVPEGIHFPLKQLEEQWNTFIKSKRFEEEFQKICASLGFQKPQFLTVKKIVAGKDIVLAHNHAIFTSIILQLIFSKSVKKSTVLHAATSIETAIISAMIAKELGIPIEIFLKSRKLSDESINLVRSLNANITSVDESPYPIPALHAFQKWLFNPSNTYPLFEEAIGPSPFPSIVKESFSPFCNKIKSSYTELYGGKPDLIILSCDYTSSLAIADYFLKNDARKIIFIERARADERREVTEFLGGITEVINPGSPAQRPIPPELCYLFDQGAIERIRVGQEIESIGELIERIVRSSKIFFTDSRIYYAIKLAAEASCKYENILIFFEPNSLRCLPS